MTKSQRICPISYTCIKVTGADLSGRFWFPSVRLEKSSSAPGFVQMFPMLNLFKIKFSFEWCIIRQDRSVTPGNASSLVNR